MSKTSKELLKAAGIKPKLRLGIKTPKGVVSTGQHRVRLIQDKVVEGTDRTGKPCEYVRFLLEEKGEQKIYQCPKLGKDGSLHYFVQRMAEINEGEEGIMLLENRGGKNFISFTPIVSGNEVEVSDDEIDDTPDVIEA